MDALEILKNDHERIKRLFRQCDFTNERKRLERIYQEVRRELVLHMDAEETVFYPVFRKYPDMSALVETLYTEHGEFKRMLAEIDGMVANSESIIAELQELNEAFDHHVHDEEADLFVRVRKMTRRPEREQLGRHLYAGREEKRAA